MSTAIAISFCHRTAGLLKRFAATTSDSVVSREREKNILGPPQ
jgi:hypothetical protein